MGRPVKYTPKVIEKIKKNLDDYIENTKIPILAEFAYKNDIPREQLYRIPELNHAIKRLINKKQVILEIGMLSGKLNSTGCIFSLKQLGWKDKQEVEHSVSPDTELTINFISNKSKSKKKTK